MLTILRSVARQVTPIALDLYDKGDTQGLLDLVARVYPNPGKEKTGTLEWITAFPELRDWVGERTVQKAFAGTMTWKGIPWEVTMEFDKYDLERDSSLVKIQDMSARLVEGVQRGKIIKALRPLRENLLTYDGQNFFDTDHTHPTGASYSNLLTVDRDTASVPTLGEAREELKKARVALFRNRVIRQGISGAPAVEKNLVVIAKSSDVWMAYDSLLNEERIGGDPNRFRNAFTLLLDFDPTSGTEDMVDFIWADPSGPRPVAVIPTREPTGVIFDESKVFSHHMVPFGMDGEMAVAPAFPQTALRIQPSS